MDIDIEKIKEEYKKYCEDTNNESDKSNFIYDYIRYNYDLGKITLSDIDKISEYLNEVL